MSPTPVGLETEAPAGGSHSARPSQPGGCEPESRVRLSTIRTVRTSDQATTQRGIDARAAEWSIRFAGDRTPQLRRSLGTGSAGSHFPRHACHAAAETNDYFP